jgi:ribosomal protein S18 acetylase RimI-like enzyme
MAARIHMVRRWHAGEIVPRPVRGGVELRDLTPDDCDDLGRLLWSAFGSEGPDGFASANAAQDETRATLAGKWGPMIWTASLLAVADQVAVAASVVLRDDAYQLSPLLAFLVTDPGHRRRGIAESVVAETLLRIDSIDVRELHLAVSAGNPALTLYRRLGFRDEPRSAPPAA